MRPLALGIGLAAAACGGPSARPQPVAPAPGAQPDAAAPADEPPAPLSEAECLAALDHFLEVAMAEKRATLPPEQVPTDEQVAAIRDTMRSEYLPQCVGGERSGYECTMQATTTAAIEACLGDTEAP